MKIAMIGHKVVPSRKGGIENVLTTLCPLLVKRGLDVTCYNRSSDKSEEEYIGDVIDGEYKGVHLKKAFTVKGRGIAAMISSYTAALSAAFGKYDVVHFHAEGPCAAMWIPKLFGKKCVATVHGLDWQREKWGKGFASKYIKLGEKTLVKHADEIIVLSESARNYFKDVYKRETKIIPNGIEKPEGKAIDMITKMFGLERDGYIAVISRLTAEKGIHYLIDAYNMTGMEKKLVIAGETSDTDEYVSFIKEKAGDNPNIIFTGFLGGDVLKELYSNAYAICLPSDIEGMSISLLEALAYKNALICSDIPENKAVAEERAIYFKKGNVEDLASRLREIFDDEELVEKFRSDADTFILKKYNWNDVADETMKLYQNLMN